MTALWTPSPDRVAASRIVESARALGIDTRPGESPYPALHRASIVDPDRFWRHVWERSGVVGEMGAAAFEQGDTLRSSRFFPGARLNVVDTLLARTGSETAVIFRGEAGDADELSWDQLRRLVARHQRTLLDAGVGEGDRVAAWMPNTPDTYALMLAAAGLGAVFSSTSPDFGAAGVIDRFGQIEPTVLVATDGYHYGGRWFDCAERLAEVTAALGPAVTTVVVPYGRGLRDLDAAGGDDDVITVPLAFDHPWYVLYSSGTTGRPKCIVHRAGGVLVKHLLEHQWHCDVGPGDRVFYFTTAGWMMWNWLASGLGSGATLVLYDGSPFHPDGNRLFDLVDDVGVTLMGVSAKYIDACRKAGLSPRTTHDLGSLRTICSTGSTLVPEGFEWVYGHVKADVHLASISGGTDLCGCLVAGDPTSPVYAGEIQRPALGMDIDIVDGELTCASAFPSMPLGFWDDPHDTRYEAAYFERYPGRWHQGDFAEWTEHGGIVIHGRSDATLNPGGVRIGTAEITRQVDALDEIAESLVIGQAWDDDTRVVLFVRTAEGVDLTEELQAAIRARIRTNASPRHVPAVIVAVDDLPRTRSGKLSELAVRDVVHDRAVANVEALANPEALALFRDLPALS